MRRPPTVDLLLTAGLAAWGLLEVVLLDGDGSTAERALWALAFTLPLAFRRRAPAGVAIGVAAAVILRIALTQDGPGEEGAMPFPALLLATYTAALLAEPLALAVAAGLATYAALLCAVFLGFFSTEPQPADAVVLSFFVFAAWGAGFVVRRRARRGTQETAAALTAERARIARELHDIVGHAVSAIAIQAGAAEQTLRRDPDAAEEQLRGVQSTARQALAEMRRLMGVLREDEAAYAPQPGLAALGGLVDDARRAGLEVDVAEEGERPALAPGLDLAAYRILQEALTNVRKHAGAARARVTVRHADGTLELEVRNERGAGGSGERGGSGLIGMRERVRVFGGTLEAGPEPDGGFRVHARLPVEAAP